LQPKKISSPTRRKRSAHIAIQALASISPYAGNEEKRDKMRDRHRRVERRARGYFPPEGFYDATPGAFGALAGQIPCQAGDSQLTM
jgi:hypothetical protein